MRTRVLLVLVFCVLFAPMAFAGFGIQLDYNHFESPEGDVQFLEGGDFGIGARTEIGSSLSLVLSFDWYFPEDEIADLQFFELNANLTFTLPTEGIRPYFGGGVGIARASLDLDLLDESKTETGINILGGIKFGGVVVTPFVEVRYVFYDDEEGFPDRFVLTGGIVF